MLKTKQTSEVSKGLETEKNVREDKEDVKKITTHSCLKQLDTHFLGPWRTPLTANPISYILKAINPLLQKSSQWSIFGTSFFFDTFDLLSWILKLKSLSSFYSEKSCPKKARKLTKMTDFSFKNLNKKLGFDFNNS